MNTPVAGAVLGREEILRHMRNKVEDPESLVITPIHRDSDGEPVHMDDDAIDLRLGVDFLLSQSDKVIANVPGVTPPETSHRATHISLGDYLVLPGHHTVLASTLEFVKMPQSVAAMVLTKSSWARQFITIETAPWVHPGYRGCLTLEIANVSEVPQILYPGFRIAQMVFMKVIFDKRDRKNSVPSYHGPTRPEVGKLKSPEETLTKELMLQGRVVRDLNVDVPKITRLERQCAKAEEKIGSLVDNVHMLKMENAKLQMQIDATKK